MGELDLILAAWVKCDANGGDAILATVVDVKGSAYRHPGARMLITSDGQRVGSISGGCLEGDVIKKSWWWTGGGKPIVRLYDTTSDEDGSGAFGLGCNGVVRVLLDRASTPETKRTIAFLDSCRSQRKPGVIATVVSSHAHELARVGDRLLVDETGIRDATIGNPAVLDSAFSEAQSALNDKRSRLVDVLQESRTVELFVEYIAPPLPFFVFGGGPDAVPVIRLAKQMGWNVTVSHARLPSGTPSGFSEADCVVQAPSDDLLAGLKIENDSFAVVMNHNYVIDRNVLRQLLQRRFSYIGMLGPRLRTERILADLNITSVPDCLHAPVGLDIGGDSPETIALSIIAEIQAAKSHRAGKMLRLSKAGVESSESIALCA